jgi:hypothetical protein
MTATVSRGGVLSAAYDDETRREPADAATSAAPDAATRVRREIPAARGPIDLFEIIQLFLS